MIYDLKTEYRSEPLGLDTPHPRFSWKIKDTGNNIMQKSYRIHVFSEHLQTLWDSGVILSAECRHIVYQGEELKSCQRAYWRVEIQLLDGTIQKSPWASFETGLLKRSDWKANWIEWEDEIDPDERKPAVYLRREFTVRSGLKRARIFQSARGLYEFWINGEKSTSDRFKPGFTSYYHRIQYQTYDITPYLFVGQNTWAVMLGDGWWRGCTGGAIYNNFGYKLQFIGQIVLDYEDGERDIIHTDDSFKGSTGGLLASDMKMGEVFDARQEPHGFKLSGFCDDSWRPVHIPRTEDSEGSHLIAAQGVPIREKESFYPTIFRDKNQDLILDYGQNIAGYVKMRLHDCQEGQKITLVHGEDIKDGIFSLDNINFPHEDIFQQIDYICDGSGSETYTPYFAVFGFRYVKLTGFEGEPEPGDFPAVAVYSDLEVTGHFICSNRLINQLATNSLWSQKGNFLDVATDCPTRERSTWTGDAQVYCNTACKFMNVYPFFEKWMYDLKLEQYEDGSLSNTFPATNAYHNIEEAKRIKKLGRIGPVPVSSIGTGQSAGILDGSAGWGDAAVHIPYIMYLNYGDIRILENQYDSILKWADYMIACSRNKNPVYESEPQYHTWTGGELDADYIFDTGYHWGEWLEPGSPEAKGPNPQGRLERLKRGNPLVATAYMYRTLRETSQIALVLGQAVQADFYLQKANMVKRIYNKYFIRDDGSIQSGHQAAYARVLAFDLCEEEKLSKVISQFAREVRDNDFKLNTGFLGTPFLLYQLADHGYPDYAMKVLEQTETPSWLYPVTRGGTTIYENWEGVDKHKGSYNHYSYGSVCEFLFERLAGIQPEIRNPGYRHFTIQPMIDGALEYVYASYECPYGTIESSWQKTAEKVRYRFTIPANTTAAVVLPGDRKRELGSGTYEFISCITGGKEND
ncbi:glycoside hydrolase family 78 protein [Lachnospiraceae bacterium ASD3451]|uniref:family 78 glycoside hydrolase catalytic domain n=1 Tax=Diplocloster agilis TaxID=2850323 RepID=UPI001DA999AA|nr:family 78 glycoside hydrolase catalytic domain [Diplocloster agilis]MBU9744397.1 glycoside hydrolase family 78 protein [Diplocloster agilis]